MYAIDTLINLYDYSLPGTLENVLSDYFIKNALKIGHKRLIDVSKETLVSSSSIIRFCKNGGYSSYSLFCDVIHQEAVEIKHGFRHLPQLSFHDDQINLLVKSLKKSAHVVFYGDVLYIRLFHDLIQYLFLNGVSVNQSQYWSAKKHREVFGSLSENDTIVIIEPHYSLPIFVEELGTSGTVLNEIHNAKARKFNLSAIDYSADQITCVSLEKGEDHYVSSCIDLAHYCISQLKEFPYEHGHI